MRTSQHNAWADRACILALVAVTTWSCTHNVTSPTTQSLSGNFIAGFVSLENDEFGNRPTDQSGSEVVVTNGVDVYKDTTSVTGAWAVYDLPAGTYSVTASKVGFTGLANGCTDSLGNVQYVGAGAYTLQRLKLAKAVSADMILSASVTYSWQYNTKVIAVGDTLKYDSIAFVTILLESRNLSTWPYDVAIVEHPDDPCGTSILNRGSEIHSDSGTVTIKLESHTFNFLKEKYGSALRGMTLYAQIRPSFFVRPSREEQPVRQCLTPYVVELNF